MPKLQSCLAAGDDSVSAMQCMLRSVQSEVEAESIGDCEEEPSPEPAPQGRKRGLRFAITVLFAYHVSVYLLSLCTLV